MLFDLNGGTDAAVVKGFYNHLLFALFILFLFFCSLVCIF